MTKSLNELSKARLKKILPAKLQFLLEEGDFELDVSEHLTVLAGLHNRMSSYIPGYLSRTISVDPEPGKCSIQNQKGTLLFADVSGFTAMSEQLSILGKEGAEEITLVVNSFFERMVGISEDHGGDLIKFGGDALILFFGGNNASHRAVHTALNMQTAMDEFDQVETSMGKFTLRMSIGLASGSIYMLSIGTENKMDYIAAGRSLERMDQAESISQSGQIVIDSQTYHLLGNPIGVEEIQTGYWLIDDQIGIVLDKDLLHRKSEAPAIDPDLNDEGFEDRLSYLLALRPYIPNPLFDHIVHDASGEAYQGSHRLVSVLFAHFYGLDQIIDRFGDENPDLILKIFNIYYCAMEEIIYRYGGTISRVDSYKSGHRILALFGALRAHENDHQLAVQAAYEMQNRLVKVNQDVEAVVKEHIGTSIKIEQRIGINSGFVFASDVGASLRREYTVMGDQVNLTARLMSVADPGEILIGESTVENLESNVHLKEKPSIQVKGKSEKINRYSLVGIVEADSSDTETGIPMSGRDIELQLAKDGMDRVKEGNFEAVVIRGESGIGKTRLMQEAASYASEIGFTVLSSYSQSFNKSMPYSAWLKVFITLFGIESYMDLDESLSANKVEQTLRNIDAEVWAPLFGSILGLNIPESQMTRILDAKVKKQKIFDLAIELLNFHAAKNSLLLRFDDVQWADPVSIELIQHVLKEMKGSPVLLMLAHRMDADMTDWAEFDKITDIVLEELPDHACIQVAKDVVGLENLSDPVIEFVLEKSSGNPLFIHEIMSLIDELGVFEQGEDDDLLVDEKLKKIEIPDTIHGMVISRIDRLPIDLRFLLQQAAVNGAEFSLDFLEGAFSKDDRKGTIGPGMDRLVDIGVVEKHVSDPPSYRFLHLTTRDVVYESISYRNRRRMHIQCGDYLEKNPESVGGDRIDLLAFHFFEGQFWDKAVEYNVLAGERAKTMFANESAIDAYSKVVEIISIGEISEDLLAIICSSKESLGEVYTLVGKYQNALENFTFAFENLCGEEDEFSMRLRQAELCRKIADVYERQSDFRGAFRWIQSGLDIVDPETPSVERAKLYLLGAGLYHRKGENDQAADWIADSIKLTEVLFTEEAIQAQAQAFYLRGAIELRTGNLSEAVKSCERSQELYIEIQDLIGEARACNNLGIALTDLGDWDQATTVLGKSLEINQQIGNVHEEGFGANNLGNIYLYKGDWDKALQLFRQSNRIWKRIGALLPDAVTLSNQAQAHIYLENWREASEMLSQAEAMFDQVGTEDFTPEILRRQGELMFKTGKNQSAQDYLERSLAKAKEQNAQLEIGLTGRILGEVFLKAGNTERAEQCLDESLATLNEIGSDHESARTLIPYAKLLIQRGDSKAAEENLNRAITSFKQRGIKSDLQTAEALLNKISK